jgi:predicted  nucleic acid-binding Zn-ribbon protein
MILTFTKVRNQTGKNNKIFDQATVAAIDMSVALGTDATQAAKQIGKALQDPVRGLTALRRSGVTFTEQQAKQIKTLVKSGDQLKAQKLILAELNKEFGGSAAAAGKTWPAQWARFREELAGLGAEIMTTMMPTFERMIGKLSNLTSWFQRLSPGTKEFLGWAMLVGAVLGPVLITLGSMVTAFSALLPVLVALTGPAGLVVLAIGAITTAAILSKDAHERNADAINNVRDAMIRLSDTKLQLDQAKLATEQASSAVQKARAQLRNTKRGTQEYKDAVLNLKQAQLGVKQAHDQETKAQKANSDAKRKAITRHDELSQRLEETRKREKNLARAIKNTGDTTRHGTGKLAARKEELARVRDEEKRLQAELDKTSAAMDRQGVRAADYAAKLQGILGPLRNVATTAQTAIDRINAAGNARPSGGGPRSSRSIGKNGLPTTINALGAFAAGGASISDILAYAGLVSQPSDAFLNQRVALNMGVLNRLQSQYSQMPVWKRQEAQLARRLASLNAQFRRATSRSAKRRLQRQISAVGRQLAAVQRKIEAAGGSRDAIAAQMLDVASQIVADRTTLAGDDDVESGGSSGGGVTGAVSAVFQQFAAFGNISGMTSQTQSLSANDAASLGLSAGGKPVVIQQYFTGEPNQFAAAQSALFQFQAVTV